MNENNNKLINILQTFVDNPERVTCKFDIKEESEVVLECGDLTVRIQGRCFSPNYQGIYFHFNESSKEQRESYTSLCAKLVSLMSIDAWRFFITTTLDDVDANFDINYDEQIRCTFQCHCCEDCMLSDCWTLKLKRDAEGARVILSSYILLVKEYVKLIDKWIILRIELLTDQTREFVAAVQAIMDKKVTEASANAASFKQRFIEMGL